MSALLKLVEVDSEESGCCSGLLATKKEVNLTAEFEEPKNGIIVASQTNTFVIEEDEESNLVSTIYEGGKGVDVVTIRPNDGDNWVVLTYAGNDNITVKGGTGHTLNGGIGNDRYNLDVLAENGNYIIDQGDAASSDRDTLYLNNYDSSEFMVEAVDGENLVIKHISLNATITVVNWVKRALNNVNFKNGRFAIKDMAYAEGTNKYTLKLSGQYAFSGSNTVTVSDCSISNRDFKAKTSVSGDNNLIDINGGSITLTSGSHNIITGNADNSVIVITAGTDNEVTINEGQTSVIINGGSENTIELGACAGQQLITFNKGAGNNNTISSFTSANDVKIFGGNGHIVECGAYDDIIVVDNENGSNYKINVGDGDDTVELLAGHIKELNLGNGYKTLVLGGAVVDNINSTGTIRYYLKGVTMTLTEATEDVPVIIGGNNTLYIDGFSTDLLNGAAGNDTFVVNSGNIGILNGKEGDDIFILNGNSNVKLIGGLGSDTYILNNLVANSTYQIDQNVTGTDQGKDVLDLTNYISSDFYMRRDDTGNLILTHKELNTSINIEGSKNNQLSEIRFSDRLLDAKFINYILESSVGVSQADVIKNFMNSLNHSTNYGSGNNGAFSEAVEYCSRGLYQSAQDLINSFKSDCMTYGGSTTAAQKEFLKNYCAIDLDNADTGAISGFDAGGPTVKTKVDVIQEPEGMTFDNLVYDASNKIKTTDFWSGATKEFSYVTINDNGNPLSIYWDEAQLQEIVDKGLVPNMDIMRQTVAAVINAWASSSLDLIYESYGMSLATEGSKLQTLSNGNKCIQLYLDYASPTVKASYSNTSSYSWVASTASRIYSGWYMSGGESMVGAREALNINMYYYSNGLADITGNPGYQNITSMYLDRVIAHELVHGAMAANISPNNYLPSFLKEGLAELIHGVDDDRRYEILTMANTNGKLYTSAGTYNQQQYLDKIFDLATPSYTLSSYSYGGGYALLRYLAKTVSDYSKEIAAKGGIDLALSDTIMDMDREIAVLGEPDWITSTTYVDYLDSQSLKISGNN